MMTYKNYLAKVIFDEDANIFHGEVINIRDVITFEGYSVDELQKSFKESIDDYLDFCLSRNEKPNSVLNGFLSLNIPVSNQKLLRSAAQKAGKDFDEWVVEVLNNQAVLNIWNSIICPPAEATYFRVRAKKNDQTSDTSNVVMVLRK